MFNEKGIREMTREPKLPHKLKWDDRTAARAGEVEYLTGIVPAGCTCLKDAGMAGAYRKYIKLKDTVHEES